MSDSSEGLVLFFHPSVELYGADRMLLESVSAVRERWQCAVVLPSSGPLSVELDALGVLVIYQSSLVVLRKRHSSSVSGIIDLAFSMPGSVYDSVKLIKKLRPAVCYVNTITIPGVLISCFLARSPSICHVHEAELGMSRVTELLITAPLMMASSIAVISHAAAAFVSGWTLNRRRTVQIPNGICSPETISPLPSSLPPRISILMIGRWSARKGMDVGIRAVMEVQRAGVEVDLMIVGGVFPGYEPYEKHLRDLSAEFGVNASFVGFVSDPSDVYRRSHIVLVPSRVEPFGLVAIEAAMQQRIVIASRVGGLPEALGDGVGGWLVEPDSPAELAAQIVACLDNWPASVARAREARQFAQREFGREAFQERVQLLVNGLTS